MVTQFFWLTRIITSRIYIIKNAKLTMRPSSQPDTSSKLAMDTADKKAWIRDIDMMYKKKKGECKIDLYFALPGLNKLQH